MLEPTIHSDVIIEGEIATVRLTGEIDVANALSVASILRHAVGATRQVRVDLSRVAFMDAAAVRVLLTARAWAVDRHGTLKVVDASPLVHRVLELMDVEQLVC